VARPQRAATPRAAEPRRAATLADYATPREDELVDTVIGRRPDGIVLTGVVHSPRVRWRLGQAHIPVVETWDFTPSPIDMLAGEVVLRAPTNVGMAREATSRLLAADAGIDAVFCSSDMLATGVLYEASARALPVPGRLAVIGFGNLSASAHTYPSLTTVAVDGARIGREVARLLLERLDGTGARPKARQILDVGSRLIAREST